MSQTALPFAAQRLRAAVTASSGTGSMQTVHATRRTRPALRPVVRSLRLCLLAGCAALLLPDLATAQPAVSPPTAAPGKELSNKETQTDGSIRADLDGYQRQQAAIRNLSDAGTLPTGSYSLSKAQCWLDVSRFEYNQNDRSDFPLKALQASQAITDAIARARMPGAAPDSTSQAIPEDVLDSNPAWATRMLDTTPQRNSLWEEIKRLREEHRQRLVAHQQRQLAAKTPLPPLQCKVDQLACAEVQLVHAQNEHDQLGWRHSRPFFVMAEDDLARARRDNGECVAVLDAPRVEVVVQEVEKFVEKEVIREVVREVPVMVPVPAPVPLPNVYVENTVCKPDPVQACPPPAALPLMAPDFGFGFNSATIDDAARTRIAMWVGQLQQSYSQISAIALTGHTDRLGNARPNKELSEKRVAAIRKELEKLLPAATVTAKGVGSEKPSGKTEQCAKDTPTKAGPALKALQDCLAPDRRVEYDIQGTRR